MLAELRAEMREMICRAAMKLFLSEGFESTSIRRIAPTSTTGLPCRTAASSAGCTTRHVCSTMSSRAKRRGRPKRGIRQG